MADLTAQIGLVKDPVGFWPRIICWVTRSPVYHVVLAVDNVRTVSAEPGGARFRPINFWPHTVWSDFDLTDEQKDLISDWGVQHIGTPYNFADDLAIGLGLLLHYKTPEWIQRYLSSDRSLECAQLADMAYQAADKHLFTDGRLSGAIFPGSFVSIFRAHDWWKVN